MKILQINTTYGIGSTGKIVKQLCDLCFENDMECLAGHRSGKFGLESIEISGQWNSRIHGVLARYTMFKGCFSYFQTKKFLKKIKKHPPDVIHLHNLHGSYVNIGVLMNYIKKNRIPTVFTLHDCWAFTAICSHFFLSGCDKWKTGCERCPQRKKYSSSPIDFTAEMWKLKKDWFAGMKNMTVVTPSMWLADLAKESFLGDYPIKVINNGIDLDVFTPIVSNFKETHNIQGKKIVLAVAFGWNYEKGIDVIIDLSNRLPEEFQIVIVGSDENIEKDLPLNILAIRRTNNQKELAKIYTAADVFINPTREENFPTVNLEALACGTPVVTFRTGGSPECIDKTCGSVVEFDDVDAMQREIVRICLGKPFSSENCIRRAKRFDKNERLKEYIDLYKSLKGDE